MSEQPAQGTRPEFNSEDVVARTGNAIRSYLAQASEEERRDALSRLQNGVLTEKGTEGKSMPLGLPEVRRPLPYTPHSTPVHRPRRHCIPQPKPTPPQPLTLTKLSMGIRHRQGPPRQPRRYLPKEDAKQKGACKSKERTLISQLRKAGSEHGLLDRMD